MQQCVYQMMAQVCGSSPYPARSKILESSVLKSDLDPHPNILDSVHP